MKYLILIPVLLLCGCKCIPNNNIVDHNVLVTVPCKITSPAKPVMPLSDGGLATDDLFTKTKKAIAEIDIRKGYEGELETAIGSCQ